LEQIRDGKAMFLNDSHFRRRHMETHAGYENESIGLEENLMAWAPGLKTNGTRLFSGKIFMQPRSSCNRAAAMVGLSFFNLMRENYSRKADQTPEQLRSAPNPSAAPKLSFLQPLFLQPLALSSEQDLPTQAPPCGITIW
jgi:hypothetical protein